MFIIYTFFGFCWIYKENKSYHLTLKDFKEEQGFYTPIKNDNNFIMIVYNLKYLVMTKIKDQSLKF